MSWDVFIINAVNAPESFHTYAIDPNWMPEPIGEADQVRQILSTRFIGVQWEGVPAWGTFYGEGFSIEIHLKPAGLVDIVMLYIRGGGNPIISILELCKQNGWVAVDCGNCNILTSNEQAARQWQEWQHYRDQVIDP